MYFEWFWLLLVVSPCYFSKKMRSLKAKTSAESQTICALGVVPGEPWGDGEAYAVARAGRKFQFFREG